MEVNGSAAYFSFLELSFTSIEFFKELKKKTWKKQDEQQC